MIDDEEVVCRDLHGNLHRVRLATRDGFATPASMLVQQIVTGPNDVPFLRKYVPAEAGRRDPRLYDLLDNEIRMIAQLTRVLGGRAGEVPVLAGYNVDVEEPFVLLRPYAGQPAADGLRLLDQDGKRRFQVGVLRALHLIGAAGVVHGALSLDVLRWNGSIVQLVDFEWAQGAGEPRRAGTGPRQSPERLQGTGVADPRDDVWSAGVLIRELVLGRQALAAPADQSADPVRLRERLDGVFRPVEQRPTAADLLRRMHVTAPDVRPVDVLAGFGDGYRMFETMCRRKGGAPPGAPAPKAEPVPGRRGWRRLFAGGRGGRDGGRTARAEA
ncbi:hypothetical protein OHA21_19145 [Actinoplanes sp. NBC_00393]|uniref:hypothetical protein n=1 Tax=Actinoplanes sp. NBC_00393 TaxID=2975953 RepID=UPI002E233C43